MVDYRFFALLFLLASTLAPPGAHHFGWQNLRHPEQSITWTRGADGSFAMDIDGHDVGRFQRQGAVIVHATGVGDPDRIPIEELVPEPTREATQCVLRGPFQGTTLRVDRHAGQVRLVDPEHRLLGADLRLQAR